MIQKTKNQIKALDLMILDLQTIHPEIRIEAKENHCEDELIELKETLLSYLMSTRKNISI